MTDLKTLVEAVEKLRTEPGDSFGDLLPCYRYILDIADAFCCQDAITRDRLEALGFEVAEGSGRLIMRHPSGIRADSDWDDWRGEIWITAEIDGRLESIRPQPQTIGDLLHLLWRLTRPETTK